MIILLIKSYLILILFISLGSIAILATGLYIIFKPVRSEDCDQLEEPHNKGITIHSHDIHAIAGDDIITTQLDLARAYIETGRKQLAKKILEFALEQGNPQQKNEAQKLLIIAEQ